MLKELDPIASKLNETRSLLLLKLNDLKEEQIHGVLVTPEWSVKDQVAHLAGAERGMFGIAQRMAKGEDPQLSPEYDNDFYNARQVAKRKERSLAEILAELQATRAELTAFLQNLTREQLDMSGQHPLYGEVTLKQLLVIVYSHETTHAREISDKTRESKK